MGRKKRKKRYRGHYCWSCGRVLPNERFSGKGHARHLCKACSRLGTEELAYRQTLRNLERCMTVQGIIARRRRKQFERFLEHDDPRIRAAALQMQAEDARSRSSLLRQQETFTQPPAATKVERI